MRRGLYVCLGALVVFLVTSAPDGAAQIPLDPSDTTTTTQQQLPTTTAPTTTTTTTRGATTTTTRSTGTNSSTTSTTKPKSTAPIPPPASGATQPLVEDLLGSPVDVTTTTSQFETVETTPTTRVSATANTATILTTKNSPSGITLVLATVAWLAAVGGLLVYAEDQRSTQWKHLARD